MSFPKVRAMLGGDGLEVADGGVIQVASGGRINLESGARLEYGGADVLAELGSMDKWPASVSMSTTPASGTCAVQLTFKDSDGIALARVTSGLIYMSNSTGLAIAGATGLAVLTNGALTELSTGKVAHFVTTAAGLLGMTVTAGAGTYYATIVLPNGKVLTTGAIVVNA